MIRPHCKNIISGAEKRNRCVTPIYVARIFAFHWRLVLAEIIDVLKMRRIGVQPVTVDDEVPVVTYLHVFVGQSHQPLDVKFVGGNSPAGAHVFRDSRSLKNHNFPPFGMAEIVAEPVNKKMITGHDLQTNNGVASLDRRRGISRGGFGVE